jgi:uncharacterized protein YndB with AHSA1/START domain
MDWYINLDRVIKAPRAKVFEAWTKAEHVKHWFTPAPLGTPVCKLDFRQGGTWDHCMRLPDGSDHWMKASFQEIKAPLRIVFRANLGGEASDSEINTTVNFFEEGASTRLNVHQVYRGLAAKLDSEQGWASTLELLEGYASKL